MKFAELKFIAPGIYKNNAPEVWGLAILKATGIVIEESLADTSIVSKLKIVSTKTEAVTEKHQAPWLRQWTLHTFEIPVSLRRTSPTTS